MIKIELKNEGSLKNSFNFISEGYYGGDQTWFTNVYPKGKKGEIQNKYGCGPVSAANITAYYAKYNPLLKDLYSESSWDVLHYTLHMDKLFSFSPKRPMILPDYIKMIKNYAASFDILFNVHKASSYGLHFNSQFENLCNNIKNGIANDAPVALLIGLNLWKGRGIFHSYNSSDIIFRGNREEKNNFTTHWVTITGYDFQKTDYSFVTASSWGADYTLNLSALMDQCLFIDTVWFKTADLEKYN